MLTSFLPSVPRSLAVLGAFALLALTCPAATPVSLPARAQQAAEHLPRGGIVLVEQNGSATPTFFTAGTIEPIGVPPEKIVFEIGSISKVFTGILLAQAVIEKKLTLHTTLREVMGAKQSFADSNVGAITLLQLATHTSGLPSLPNDLQEGSDLLNPYAHYDRAHLAACLAKAHLDHAPPFASSYSNLGVGLLGDILATLQDKTWESLVTERIAKPLGMGDTCVTLNADQAKRFAPAYAGNAVAKPWTFNAIAGAGALRSTAADMLIFARALADPGTTPLKDAIELVERPQAGGDIGLCLQLTKLSNGGRAFWFQGGTGGFRSWISARPADGRLVVMLVNNNAFMAQDVIFGTLKPIAATDSPTDASLAEYVGDYDTGVKKGDANIHYSFTAKGHDLWLQITGQPAIPLERDASKKDRFAFKPVKAEIQFKRLAGKVVSTTLFQAGLEINATKIRATAKP